MDTVDDHGGHQHFAMSSMFTHQVGGGLDTGERATLILKVTPPLCPDFYQIISRKEIILKILELIFHFFLFWSSHGQGK